ncbi:hypothetical protein Zm00014a_040545 [Zea mays]|uniref:Uncharacterized protein n=1 Tax=Zea mays TaxID=4577 RepID=A0A3L6F2Y5_MAIZE|nr:hypothetical protein Zm00014a_040545 [Zea mays]
MAWPLLRSGAEQEVPMADARPCSRLHGRQRRRGIGSDLHSCVRAQAGVLAHPLPWMRPFPAPRRSAAGRPLLSPPQRRCLSLSPPASAPPWWSAGAYTISGRWPLLPAILHLGSLCSIPPLSIPLPFPLSWAHAAVSSMVRSPSPPSTLGIRTCTLSTSPGQRLGAPFSVPTPPSMDIPMAQFPSRFSASGKQQLFPTRELAVGTPKSPHAPAQAPNPWPESSLEATLAASLTAPCA